MSGQIVGDRLPPLLDGECVLRSQIEPITQSAMEKRDRGLRARLVTNLELNTGPQLQWFTRQ